MSEEKKDKLSFIEFLKIITKWKRLIIINLILILALSVTYSLLQKNWYKATSTVLPPANQQMGSGLSSILNSLPLGAFGVNTGSADEMTYLAILKSRKLKTEVINRFDLRNFYETETLKDALIAFSSDYDIQQTEENMIMISFEYPDSVKVAEIVNFIVGKLGIYANSLMLERAKNSKEFIEKRYFRNLEDIDSLTNDLEDFQNKFGILEFEEQTKSLIVSIAEIEADVYYKEAELDVIKKSYGINSPQHENSKIELESLKNKLNEIKFQKNNTSSSPFESLFLPVDQIPKLGKKYAKLYTDLLLQSKLQEFLLPEYEQAKLQLMKEKPTLQVLDFATVPDKKSRPKRSLIVLGSLIFGFTLSIVFILFVEHLMWIKKFKPEEYNKLILVKKGWLNPFSKT